MDFMAASQFLADRQANASRSLHLYGLVDGVHCKDTHGESTLIRSTCSSALFDGTPEESLAFAGPWLLDWDRSSDICQQLMVDLSDGEKGCIWITSELGLDELAADLRERLEVTLPDGAQAILRFYDARISKDVLAILDARQRSEFFRSVHDWSAEVLGEVVTVYSNHEN